MKVKELKKKLEELSKSQDIDDLDIYYGKRDNYWGIVQHIEFNQVSLETKNDQKVITLSN